VFLLPPGALPLALNEGYQLYLFGQIISYLIIINKGDRVCELEDREGRKEMAGTMKRNRTNLIQKSKELQRRNSCSG
jgi:hypothetical protein